MLNGLYILWDHAFDAIYGPDERADIAKLVNVPERAYTADEVKQNPALLKDVHVIFSGWGGPRLDQQFLDAAINLQAIFYGAGSIKAMVTPEFWVKKIPITSSYAANAVPVAEWTLAQILLSLKRFWSSAVQYKTSQQRGKPEMAGGYGSTVGLVSLGMIGARVARLMQPFDMKVIAYDPFASAERAAELKLELVSLEDVFRRSDVISLHTPWLPETVGMINGRLLSSMKAGATLINTARGAIINEGDLCRVLAERTDLWALLDVTHPEPPEPESPLWTLPNVVLTPHLAGSVGVECRRMGRLVVDELRRFIHREPLQWVIDEKRAQVLA
jgi:phosphoglycerate dehydrogenase-like enzyme